MNRILLILFLLSSIGCATNHKEANEQQREDSTNEYVSTKAPQESTETSSTSELNNQAIEILYMDSVWLNDKIQFSSTQLEVKEKLGEPDSITTPNFECGAYIAGEEPWGDTVNIWHYQGTKIVTYRDKAEIMLVKLRDWDCTLHDSRIIFSGHTSLVDLAEVFPNSTEKAYDWKDVRDGMTYKLVRIAPKENWDDQWVLKFLDNKLIEIEYWIPC